MKGDTTKFRPGSIFAIEKHYFAVVAYQPRDTFCKIWALQVKKRLAEMVFNFFAQICFFITFR